jgi:hypothetical protein
VTLEGLAGARKALRRAARAATGTVAAGGTADITVTLDPPMPSGEYTAIATAEQGGSSEGLTVLRIVSKTASQVVVRVLNRDALLARSGTVHVIAEA